MAVATGDAIPLKVYYNKNRVVRVYQISETGAGPMERTYTRLGSQYYQRTFFKAHEVKDGPLKIDANEVPYFIKMIFESGNRVRIRELIESGELENIVEPQFENTRYNMGAGLRAIVGRYRPKPPRSLSMRLLRKRYQ